MFAPKHVVTMVCAICAATVLAPTAVAASGTLNTIVDAYDVSRRARVSKSNALYVDTRPRVSTGAFNAQIGDVTDVLRHKLAEAVAPSRIAVTEMMVTVLDNGSSGIVGNNIELSAYVRMTGTEPCAGAGWTKTLLRTVTVTKAQTVQLAFAGPPLVLPAALPGQLVCLAFQQTRWMGATTTHVAVTGFTYVS
jgi:hypothetical protein